MNRIPTKRKPLPYPVGFFFFSGSFATTGVAEHFTLPDLP